MKKLLIALLLMVVVILQSQTIYLQNVGGEVGYFNTETRSFVNVTTGSAARLELLLELGNVDVYSLYNTYFVYALHGEPFSIIIHIDDNIFIWREVKVELE